MPSSSDVQATPVRPKAGVIGAYIEGWRRAIRAPGLTLTVWAITTLVALPLAAVLHSDIVSHLGSSLTSEQVAQGWDADWTGEFAADARGVSSTFTREILGGAGTVATLSRLLDGEPPPLSLVGAIAAYLTIWIFLSGGIVDRLARARPLGAAAFLSLCGGYFFRLVRLAAAAGLAYWLLFRFVHPLLFESLFDRWTRDLTNESQGLALLGALYAAFAILLGIVSLLVDFTRVRIVVDDRRSVLASFAAALRFVRRRFWRCSALYAINIAGQIVLALLWLQMAPGAGSADWTALLVTQVYLIVRIWARLAFLGSETAFYQGELAHAQYTAAPLPRWPDSASVEAIRNLRRG